MKKCPYCAEEIQDEAIVCRFCGRDLRDESPTVQPTQSSQPVQSRPVASMTPLLIGVSAVGWILLLWSAYALFTDSVLALTLIAAAACGVILFKAENKVANAQGKLMLALSVLVFGLALAFMLNGGRLPIALF